MVVQSSHWSSGRAVLVSAAIAGATGAATGAISLGSAFDLAARSFFGSRGGLVVGAAFGALASSSALLLTWLLERSGVRRSSVLRLAFVLCGTAIAALSVVPLLSGAWVARHSIRVPG
ncbi:hypothetical protein GCU67_19870 [Modestobacter muralis]|uniref:Uncharacterized protein n=1 Tax=Modestobacter muralis TaxID=1608614 RepID=A0A6P0HCV2_9ACTN|nr:hypothetical protein [Modestobacter muralis]NEK96405.1 hypothetical protein [Modestobacter muralis]NEN53305.1 hypothetical protein [Modestobacter muralis]